MFEVIPVSCVKMVHATALFTTSGTPEVMVNTIVPGELILINVIKKNGELVLQKMEPLSCCI